MTFLGEIIELYIQLGNFFKTLMPTLNKERKWLNFKSINVFAKTPSQLPIFVLTELLHDFH